jgi:2'-5' RNA ligase
VKAGMVALLPDNPDQLTVTAGVGADQIHLTLAYLGDDVTSWDDTRRRLLEQLVWSAAHSIGQPITGRVMGHATFNPDRHAGREPCAVHLVGDSESLGPAHQQLCTVLSAALGDEFPAQHTPFIPHITAGEGLTAANLSYTGPVVFGKLALALAGEWTVVPITTDPAEAIAPYARTAYAQGWARSGGPLTDRVHAGCRAAVELAIANAADPNVLEATLKLGALEGAWAAVYARRETLVAHHVTNVTRVWRQSANRLDVRAAVGRLRQSLGISEYVNTDDSTHRRLVTNAVAGTVVGAIAGADAAPADREAIIGATADALADAEPEGYAGAVLVGAEQADLPAPAADVVASDYQAQLADLGSHWADATGWVGKMVQGNATDLGGRLSQMVADGASFDDMVDGARDIIGGDDVRAVSTLLDMAMGQSFTRGALALYAREGVTQVDFMTAGGSNVCPLCQQAEAQNPWDRSSAPTPPLHPYCRCALSATDPMSGLAALLSGLSVASAG